MKKKFRYIIILIFAVLVFGRLGKVLEADYDGNQAMNGFYQLPRNSVDVMFYGNSHIYAGVNTVGLWDEYGIAGYDLAGTMQTTWNSYYNMEETLKYQSPKMMVVDVYGALLEEEYYMPTNVIKNASSMRFSWNKIKNIWSSVPHKDFLSYLLSYPLTHDSYKYLQRANYVEEINQIGGKWYKGFKPSFAYTEYEKLPVVKTELPKKEPSEKNKSYIEKMVNLAKENQIQLAFIVVPYAGWQEDDESVYCWIEDFARENDILFFNGNRYLEEMNFDCASDYAEDSHLNYNGACKFTKYLGGWLKSNCEMEDHQGDKLYDSWQKYSESWNSYRNNMNLASITDIETYVKELQSNEEYTIFISVDDKYQNDVYVDLLEELPEVSLHDFQAGGTVIIEGGKLIYRTPDEPEYLWYMETESLDIAVVRKYGEQMDIMVNNQKQNGNYNDVTILVYDNELDMIVDVVAYNSDGVMLR